MTRTALLSVYYKDGLEELARALTEMDWQLVSSGGTSEKLKSWGIPHRQVEEVTGSPEMMDGRVKTMHPKITGGILADRRKPSHLEDAKRHEIGLIDLVVCNLYPFEATVASGASWDDCIEKIDIGGPTMVRSAAKNYHSVAVLVDPTDYEELLRQLKLGAGETTVEFRKDLAAKAFAHTAAYDLAIAGWISEGEYEGLIGRREMTFKYGENQNQTPAYYYRRQGDDELAFHRFARLDGTEPSYNNAIEIADRQRQTVAHIAAGWQRNFGHTPLIAIATKHGNCCAASVGTNRVQVMKDVIWGDRTAIHGGLVMTNFPIDGELADLLRNWEIGDAPRRLLDAVSAPYFDDDALELLRRKGKENKCRVFTNPALANLGEHSLDHSKRWRFLPDGFAVQPNYTFVLDFSSPDFQWVYGEPQDEQVLRDAVLAWAVGCTSNSNTIALARGEKLVGNGVGQQDRVGAAELSLKRAADAGHAGDAEWLLSFMPGEELPEFEAVRRNGQLTGEQVLRFKSQILPKLRYRFENWDHSPRVVAYSDSFMPFPDAAEALLGAGIWTVVGTSGSVNDHDVEDAFIQVGLLGWQEDKLARGFAFH